MKTYFGEYRRIFWNVIIQSPSKRINRTKKEKCLFAKYQITLIDISEKENGLLPTVSSSYISQTKLGVTVKCIKRHDSAGCGATIAE